VTRWAHDASRFLDVKLLAAVFIALSLAVAALPAVLVGGDTSPLSCGPLRGGLDAVLRTIQTIESGGDYTAQARGSSASGAYQFTDGTWANYAGYRRAWQAPPEIQDAKAAAHVSAILDAHNQNISAIPVVWYLGHLPEVASPAWDRIPSPRAGNRLTPRQYQARWMDLYVAISGTEEVVLPPPPGAEQPPVPVAPSSAPPSDLEDGEPGGSLCGGVEPMPGGWALPGPRHLIDSNPGVLDRPHHDYPAWDWGIPVNTPIYAIRGGTISSVHTFRPNWFAARCRPGAGCDPCGVGITIIDDSGARWTYCHGTELTVRLGQVVAAGQQIMWSGNSGRSTGPHLHLGLSTDGTRRCPQRLLVSLYVEGRGLDPRLLPTAGCTS
jgi:murein DD-endopeptidase MepM/ murein hydrolase activator NlpD